HRAPRENAGNAGRGESGFHSRRDAGLLVSRLDSGGNRVDIGRVGILGRRSFSFERDLFLLPWPGPRVLHAILIHQGTSETTGGKDSLRSSRRLLPFLSASGSGHGIPLRLPGGWPR